MCLVYVTVFWGFFCFFFFFVFCFLFFFFFFVFFLFFFAFFLSNVQKQYNERLKPFSSFLAVLNKLYLGGSFQY